MEIANAEKEQKIIDETVETAKLNVVTQEANAKSAIVAKE